jgi:hypothetical protein
MTTETDYLICLLDVLGFESLFNEHGLEIIESKYRDLIATVEEQNIDMALLIGPGGHPMIGSPNIQSAYFSDTIIFWCKYDIFRMEVMLNCIKEVICKSIEIGLPLRGSVSIGHAKLEKNQSIFLRKPIISAARAVEFQKSIGITLSKDFDKVPYCQGFKADCILQYDNYLKENWKERVIPLVVDFPRHWRLRRNHSLKDAIKKLDKDEKHTEYYRNTIDFVTYSEDNHDWWLKHPGYIAELRKIKKDRHDS